MALERGAVARHADGLPAHLRPGRAALHIRHELFLRAGAGDADLPQQARPDGAADAQLGSFLPGNGVGGARRALERPDLALPAHAISWPAATTRSATARTACPEDMTDPGLGRHLRRARAVLRPVRVSVRHLRQGRQPERRRSRPAATRSKGARRANTRRRRMAQPYGPTLFAKAAQELGLPSVPAALRQPVAGLHQPARRAARRPAPIAASARGSAAATTPRRARRPRSCRC